MKEKKDADIGSRGPERRGGDERRRVHTDSSELPFPDRRKIDRRQQDRRILTESEREELLKKIKDESSGS